MKLSHVFALGLFVSFGGLPTAAFAHHGLVHEGCPVGQSFAAGDIVVTGAFTRATLPTAQTGGGYFNIENKGASPDRLAGASSEAASAIQIHQMTMDNNVMKMGPVEGGLEIPAGGSVALVPSGYHLMMMGIGTPFEEGQCVKVTLEFEHAGALDVMFNIGSAAQADAPTGHEGMQMPTDHMSGMDMSGMSAMSSQP